LNYRGGLKCIGGDESDFSSGNGGWPDAVRIYGTLAPEGSITVLQGGVVAAVGWLGRAPDAPVRIPADPAKVAPEKAKRSKRKWDLSPLSPTGTRWFTVGWLVRLPTWPWSLSKTKRLFKLEPDCCRTRIRGTSKKRGSTSTKIPEAVAFRVWQRELTLTDD
jgi:hypothetical protein